VWAQAYFAIDKEWAVTVDDVISRRTTLAVRGLAGAGVRAELGELVGRAAAKTAPEGALRRSA
jgi:glycerol-3-phosphate dehydrogenase